MSKCNDLEIEIGKMWHLKSTTVPVIVGALSIIKGHYRIYTPIFLNSQWEARRTENSGKKRIDCVDKWNSFGDLIVQNSQVPVILITSARFEFLPRKNKSCVWSRSRDIVIYIFHAFRNNYIFCFFALSHSVLSSERPTAPNNSTVSDTELNHGRTYGYRKHVSHIEIGMYIIIQTNPFFSDFNIASHIQIHTFIQRAEAYFTAMYFLIFTHTYTHVSRNYLIFTLFVLMTNTRTYRYVRTTHTYTRIIVVLYTPTHTHTNAWRPQNKHGVKTARWK